MLEEGGAGEVIRNFTMKKAKSRERVKSLKAFYGWREEGACDGSGVRCDGSPRGLFSPGLSGVDYQIELGKSGSRQYYTMRAVRRTVLVATEIS
jgi:hypothetical protein